MKDANAGGEDFLTAEEERGLVREHRAAPDGSARREHIEGELLSAHEPLFRAAVRDVAPEAYREWRDEQNRVARGERIGEGETRAGWVDELLQDARLLMLTALRGGGYDPERGRIGGYVKAFIHRALGSAVLEHREGTADRKLLDPLKRLSAVKDAFVRTQGRQPTRHELAERVFPDLELSEAQERLDGIQARRAAKSLDEKVEFNRGPDKYLLGEITGYEVVNRDGYLAGYTPPEHMEVTRHAELREQLQELGAVVEEMVVEGNLNRGMLAALEWAGDMLPEGEDREDYADMAAYIAVQTGKSSVTRRAALKTFRRALERVRCWFHGVPNRALSRDHAGRNIDTNLPEYRDPETPVEDDSGGIFDSLDEAALLDRIDPDRLSRTELSGAYETEYEVQGRLASEAAGFGSTTVVHNHNRVCRDCGLSAPAPLTDFEPDQNGAYERANLCRKCGATRFIERITASANDAGQPNT